MDRGRQFQAEPRSAARLASWPEHQRLRVPELVVLRHGLGSCFGIGSGGLATRLPLPPLWRLINHNIKSTDWRTNRTAFPGAFAIFAFSFASAFPSTIRCRGGSCRLVYPPIYNNRGVGNCHWGGGSVVLVQHRPVAKSGRRPIGRIYSKELPAGLPPPAEPPMPTRPLSSTNLD